MSLGSIIQPGKRFLRYSPTIHRTTVSSRPAASLPQLRSFSSATPNPHELFPSTAFYRLSLVLELIEAV